MSAILNLHILIDGQQWHILSVPLADIRRLCHRPLKWLRFVAYAICGAEGTISLAGGGLVDYEDTLPQSQGGDYCYTPEGDCHFVDPGVTDERTSLASSRRAPRFRKMLQQRDGFRCLFTGCPTYEAAHIIPHSKGDNYIAALVQNRGRLYGANPSTSRLGIDSLENGLLVNNIMHTDIGKGICAFLKTPNFALATDDIPHVGDTPDTRYTVQFFDDDPFYHNWHNSDAHFRGDGTRQPCSLFFDVVYGASVFNTWAAGDMSRA
ncbi:hypothetical protein BOTBODRAFT_586308 [Botryobasidium botryosum FD-172 SS1]|uniref:HNH nuclease domain-containing protein n=1 Tax=Botryobasidium botryosum (strain FD-172 SS1) TaxID=930990 RepID=A0A067M8Y7_BOTB1|nr:hypothetical protein BOTBODRAFT_586308 [Botryobasidium botryosum FD-172 SS1]